MLLAERAYIVSWSPSAIRLMSPRSTTPMMQMCIFLIWTRWRNGSVWAALRSRPITMWSTTSPLTAERHNLHWGICLTVEDTRRFSYGYHRQEIICQGLGGRGRRHGLCLPRRHDHRYLEIGRA